MLTLSSRLEYAPAGSTRAPVPESDEIEWSTVMDGAFENSHCCADTCCSLMLFPWVGHIDHVKTCVGARHSQP